MNAQDNGISDNFAFETDKSKNPKKINGKILLTSAVSFSNQNWGRRNEDHSIRITLIDDRRLTLDSVSQLLSRCGPEFKVFSFSNVDELLNHHVTDSEKSLDVVLLSVGGAKHDFESVCKRVEQLQQEIPDTPVIILSDQEDADCIHRAFQMGVRGYITTTLAPAIVREAIRLVQAGGIFIPTNLTELIGARMMQSSTGEGANKPLELAKAVENLTPRELEVLQTLRDGKPNKIIAYELDMQECTVKVHVRNIMKKLKTTNRTQTALIASQVFTT